VITGGSLVVQRDPPGASTIEIQGTQGLRLSSFGDAHNKFGNNCVPGSTGDVCNFGGTWDQIFATATIEINGVVRTFHSPDVFFFGQFSTDPVVLPPTGTSAAVLSAPFRLGGSLSLFDPETGGFDQFPLVGHGLARLELTSSIENTFWEFDGSRFDFRPVPEPTTVSLLGLGLVGVEVRRWRGPHLRRHGCRPPPG